MLTRRPPSVDSGLKGNEVKDLIAAENVYEEYLWLLKVNAPGTDVESRTVELFRLIEGKCDSKGSTLAGGGPAVDCTDDAADTSDRSHVVSLTYLQIK